MEDYLMRGFGYISIINNKVCGFCTSEYPSKNAIAIGIEVLEEYQRQGYAKAMAKAFVYKALQRGFTIYWECWRRIIMPIWSKLMRQIVDLVCDELKERIGVYATIYRRTQDQTGEVWFELDKKVIFEANTKAIRLQ